MVLKCTKRLQSKFLISYEVCGLVYELSYILSFIQFVYIRNTWAHKAMCRIIIPYIYLYTIFFFFFNSNTWPSDQIWKSISATSQSGVLGWWRRGSLGICSVSWMLCTELVYSNHPRAAAASSYLVIIFGRIASGVTWFLRSTSCAGVGPGSLNGSHIEVYSGIEFPKHNFHFNHDTNCRIYVVILHHSRLSYNMF